MHPIPYRNDYSARRGIVFGVLCIIGVFCGHLAPLSAATEVQRTNAAGTSFWTDAGTWSGTDVYPNGDYNVTLATASSANMLGATESISINRLAPASGIAGSIILGESRFSVKTWDIATGTSQVIRGDTTTASIGELNLINGVVETFRGVFSNCSIGAIEFETINLTAGGMNLGPSSKGTRLA